MSEPHEHDELPPEPDVEPDPIARRRLPTWAWLLVLLALLVLVWFLLAHLATVMTLENPT